MRAFLVEKLNIDLEALANGVAKTGFIGKKSESKVHMTREQCVESGLKYVYWDGE